MTLDKRASESTGSAMYMLWPLSRPLPAIPAILMGYSLSMVVSEDIDNARALVEADGRLSDPVWSRFRDAVVPDGMFVIQERASPAWVGTISAVHNPAATRFYFPGGGELGYLVVAPDHRRRGLGAAMITAASDACTTAGIATFFSECNVGGSLRFEPICESVPAFHPCARTGPALGIRLRSVRRGTRQIRMAD